jgi:hypothetical protein
MKNLFKVLALVMVICVAVFALTGCGEEKNEGGSTPANNTNVSSNSIVGYWKNDSYGADFIYTFNDDGTGNYYVAGADMPFTYKTNGDQLSILFDGDDASFDTTYEVKGNVLNVADSLGEDTLYDRIDASELPKPAQIGTAGSSMPLKDNPDEARSQVEYCFQNWIDKAYCDKITESNVHLEKIYSS